MIILPNGALWNFLKEYPLPENFNNPFNTIAIDYLLKFIAQEGNNKIFALRCLGTIVVNNPQLNLLEYIREKNAISLLIDQLKFEKDLQILETTIWVIASLSADLAHQEIIRTYLTDRACY